MEGMEAASTAQRATTDAVGIHCRSASHAALVVRREVARDRFLSGVREALQELKRALARAGEPPREVPFIAFHAITPHSVDLEVGVPVEASSGVSDGQRTTIPLGRYVSLMAHLTPDALTEAYAELTRWLAQQAEHCTGPVYTTVTLGEEGQQDSILIQRRICAGRELSDESCTGSALFDAPAAELAALALQLLSREDLPNEAPVAGRALDALRSLGRGPRVADVMSVDVVSCQRSDSLAVAAQRMWEHDVGALPVLAADARPIAMITDRDICMATYTQGRRLTEIPVGSAMSRELYVCNAEDPLLAAEQQMAAHQVRRLPVLNAGGELVGLLSLNDVVSARTKTTLNALMERVTGDVTSALAEISRQRTDTHN